MPDMNRRYMVKQYVAVVKNSRGRRFRVFRTGDDKFYLFDPMDEYDCSTCCQFPVRKSDLRPEMRSALNSGWGNG